MTDAHTSALELLDSRLDRFFTFVHRVTFNWEHLTLGLVLSHYSSDLQAQITLQGLSSFHLDIAGAQEDPDLPLDLLRLKVKVGERRLHLVTTTGYELNASFSRLSFEPLQDQDGEAWPPLWNAFQKAVDLHLSAESVVRAKSDQSSTKSAEERKA